MTTRRPRSVLVWPLLVVLAGVCGCGGGQSDRAAAAAASKAAADAARARARAEAAGRLEAQRLADLWTYTDVPAGKGRQLTASLRSRDDVDTGGDRRHPVLLVFRDHPSWGKSSYLVLQAGDFNCRPRCTVRVTADDATPRSMAARRPQTDEAIAMFINDARALWRLTRGARVLSIEFPVKAGGTRTATFDVAGLDGSKLPGWDPGTKAKGSGVERSRDRPAARDAGRRPAWGPFPGGLPGPISFATMICGSPLEGLLPAWRCIDAPHSSALVHVPVRCLSSLRRASCTGTRPC